MKCSMILHFIWVFTVCKSARLGVSRIQRVNQTLTLFPQHQLWYSLEASLWDTSNESNNRWFEWILTFCLLGTFVCFFVVCWFFFIINFFERFFQEYHQSQTVWIQIRPDIMSGLILVQSVCKSYQQMTLVGSILTPVMLNIFMYYTPPQF